MEMPCQHEFYFCTVEMTREQSAGLQQLLNDLNGLSLETYPLPTNLMRIRICDGREIYVLPEWLDYLGGYYTIVDQILITSYLQELDVDFPDGSTHTVIFKDLGSVLFTVGMEITINGYESCFEELPCDDAPVTCEVPYQTERQNDWIQNVLIGSFFPGQSSGNIIYPSKLYRVRFCEGLELYLFHQELYAGYSLGGYKILQVIEVPGAGQNFEVKDATGIRILVGVQAFLSYRSNLIDDFAVSGYNCAPFPIENGETCPDDEIAGQQAALAQVRSSMSERTPSTIQIPQDLLRIKFCDGTEDHILTEELPLLSGTLHELQNIPIEDTLQTYQTATLNGVGGLSLGEMLQLRSTPQAMYLEGFDPQDPVEAAPLPPVWGGGDPFGETLNQLKDAPIPEVSFYILDHLGNTRILYHTTFTDCNQAAVQYHLEHVADYYPFGKTLREYVAQGLPEKFLTTQHERDVETGLDYRGARFYDSEVGRFLGVDPLAGVYAGWSPYNYTLDNPVRFIDPDGRDAQSPIYDREGNFLGTDSEGFTGKIIIMDRDAFNAANIIFKGTSTVINGKLDHAFVSNLTKYGEVAWELNDASLTAKEFSKIYTHITKELASEGISFDRLEGGIINVVDFPVDDESGNMGHAFGDSYGKYIRLSLDAEAATLIGEDGMINVTTALLGGDGQFETVEHVQSTLGIHEYIAHGLMGVPNTFPGHSKAYLLQYQHKRTYNKLSKQQQYIINENME